MEVSFIQLSFGVLVFSPLLSCVLLVTAQAVIPAGMMLISRILPDVLFKFLF